jgi:hypothetical protein
VSVIILIQPTTDKLGWVAAPLSKYYSTVDPYITSADTRVDTLLTKAERIKSKTVEKTQLSTQQALELKEQLSNKAHHKAQQAIELRKRLSAKAVERLTESFSHVREFSETRGKEIIHIDLIAYAEEVLDNAKNVAKPTYLAVQKQLAMAIENVSTSVSALQEAVVTSVDRAELLEKLEVALVRIRELAKYGKSYVYQNIDFLRQLAIANVETSIAFIQDYPEKLQDYKVALGNLDVEKELKTHANSVIEQANNLLVSVTNLVRVCYLTLGLPIKSRNEVHEDPTEEEQHEHKD